MGVAYIVDARSSRLYPNKPAQLSNLDGSFSALEAWHADDRSQPKKEGSRMEYAAPTTVDEARTLLADNPGSRVFAGATDVVPQMRSVALSPRC